MHARVVHLQMSFSANDIGIGTFSCSCSLSVLVIGRLTRLVLLISLWVLTALSFVNRQQQPLIKPAGSLSLDDIDVIKVIGKGNGGIVQLVRHKWSGQFFALKVKYMGIYILFSFCNFIFLGHKLYVFSFNDNIEHKNEYYKPVYVLLKCVTKYNKPSTFYL